MSVDGWLVVLGALALAVVLGSGAERHLPLTEPLVALLVGVVLGPEGTGLLTFPGDTGLLHTTSELVMALALMAVALRFPVGALRDLRRPLAWLLTVGMLGMAAVVALLAWGILDLDPAAAFLLAAVLMPTDPVLSSNVVSGAPAEEVVPERLRQMLSIESGANDGLAFPLVLLGIVAVQRSSLDQVLVEGLLGVVIAVVAGVAIGTGAGTALRYLSERKDVEASAYFVATLVLALFALGAINGLGGNGVLGVFVTGLAYNRVVARETSEIEFEVDEGVNKVLVLPVFVFIGLVLPWSEWARLGLPLILFVAGVLLLRRLPVIAALQRPLGLDAPGVAFYGWFGPIGVAAVFLATEAVERGAADGPVWPAAMLVVAASTVVHGATAAPGRALFRRMTSRT